MVHSLGELLNETIDSKGRAVQGPGCAARPVASYGDYY
jgi:hypothetical protein